MTQNSQAPMPMLASCRFGLESVLAAELQALGALEITCENALVRFKGDWNLLARANICLRTAERVFLELKRFEAKSFETLFDATYSINWPDYLSKNDAFHIKGKTAKSQLHSVSDCQSIVKKAIVEKMKKRYKINWFPETGRTYVIEIALLDNIATIMVDASGAGLSRRGYRLHQGEAPLPETIAAGILLLSRWRKDSLLRDPFCGAGTIAIEAAMLAKNIAPGIHRDFAAEEWAWMPEKVWKEERNQARELEKNNFDYQIKASDIDAQVLDAARYNAMQLDLEINFTKADALTLNFEENGGWIVTNPPYGERMLDKQEARKLYKQFGQKLKQEPNWRLTLLTADAEFERFFGARADKRRKIYNSGIACQLYQYFKKASKNKSLHS